MKMNVSAIHAVRILYFGALAAITIGALAWLNPRPTWAADNEAAAVTNDRQGGLQDAPPQPPADPVADPAPQAPILPPVQSLIAPPIPHASARPARPVPVEESFSPAPLPWRQAAPAKPVVKKDADSYTRTMIVTAYCPCPICCGKWAAANKGRRCLACGELLRPLLARGKAFVAAPDRFDFGTLIRVPGYAGGRAVPVLDRGGEIEGNHLDVFFPRHEQAQDWGVRRVHVKIQPVPDDEE